MACPGLRVRAALRRPPRRRRSGRRSRRGAGPGALGFRLLILPTDLYDRLGGDPFAIADQFPPIGWRGDLPALEWTAVAAAGPHGGRSAEGAERAAQRHAPGRRPGVARRQPARLRAAGARSHVCCADLWALLPTSRRGDLWPATFAFGNARGFHVLSCRADAGRPSTAISPRSRPATTPKAPTSCGCKPPSRPATRRRMDALFAGRSRGRWIRIAFLLCALAILNSPFILMFIKPAPPSPPAPAAVKPALPAADACPPLDDHERQQLADSLQQLARQHGIDVPHETTAAALTDSIEKIDRSLIDGEPGRDPGRLRDLGPVQRQLRRSCGSTASPITTPPDLLPSKWWKNCTTKSARNSGPLDDAASAGTIEPLGFDTGPTGDNPHGERVALHAERSAGGQSRVRGPAQAAGRRGPAAADRHGMAGRHDRLGARPTPSRVFSRRRSSSRRAASQEGERRREEDRRISHPGRPGPPRSRAAG